MEVERESLPRLLAEPDSKQKATLAISISLSLSLSLSQPCSTFGQSLLPGSPPTKQRQVLSDAEKRKALMGRGPRFFMVGVQP